jgi:hypothetical protein
MSLPLCSFRRFLFVASSIVWLVLCSLSFSPSNILHQNGPGPLHPIAFETRYQDSVTSAVRTDSYPDG